MVGVPIDLVFQHFGKESLRMGDSVRRNVWFRALKPTHIKDLRRHADQFWTDSSGEPPFDKRAVASIGPYLKEGVATRVKKLHKQLDDNGYGARTNASERLKALQLFASDHTRPNRIYDPNYRDALATVKREVLCACRQGRLKPLVYHSNDDIMDAVSKKTASAGADMYVTGLAHKGDYSDIAMDYWQSNLTTALQAGRFLVPIRGFSRLSPKFKHDQSWNVLSTKCKDRLVSAIGWSVTTTETIWSKSVQEYACIQWRWYATGDCPETKYTRVHNMLLSRPFWASIDYSAFDQHLVDWLIRDAFNLIRELYVELMPGGDPYRKRLWDTMVQTFIVKDFIGPKGELWHSEHGVPSGSMWTNLIDSVCNEIMIRTYENYLRKKTGVDPRFDTYICGDDNFFVSMVPIDRKDLAGYMDKVFGADISADKTEVGHGEVDFDPPTFCSGVYRKDGIWRDPAELWAKLAYPERFRDYSRHPEMLPEHIIQCYIREFPRGMDELMNVAEFQKDHLSEITSIPTTAWQSIGGLPAFEHGYGYRR